MKTKIYILLVVLISLAGISEVKAQDTLWTRAIGAGKFTLDGSKVYYVYVGQGIDQLVTADSGRVIWTDSTARGGSWMTPDSLYFAGPEGWNIYFRRLSDGTVVKKYDTLIVNNYPKYMSLKWRIERLTFSKDGRYLFFTTSDHIANMPIDSINNMIYKVDMQTDRLVALIKVKQCKLGSIATNDSFLICSSNHGIFFFSLEDLSYVKKYNDGNDYSLYQSKSGRYITTTSPYGDIQTWDTQRDSIIKKSKLDSVDTYDLAYTNNDSIVYLDYVKNKIEHILKFNLFTEQRLNDFIFDYDYLSIGSIELSGDDSKLLANIEHGGVFVYDLTSQPSAKKDNETPQSSIQVTPNPTLGSTKIEITTEQSENVKILLFDANGKFIMDIVEKYLDTGTNTITFSTKNIPNGSYLVNVKGQQINQTKKLVIYK